MCYAEYLLFLAHPWCAYVIIPWRRLSSVICVICTNLSAANMKVNLSHVPGLYLLDIAGVHYIGHKIISKSISHIFDFFSETANR